MSSMVWVSLKMSLVASCQSDTDGEGESCEWGSEGQGDWIAEMKGLFGDRLESVLSSSLNVVWADGESNLSSLADDDPAIWS